MPVATRATPAFVGPGSLCLPLPGDAKQVFALAVPVVQFAIKRILQRVTHIACKMQISKRHPDAGVVLFDLHDPLERMTGFLPRLHVLNQADDFRAVRVHEAAANCQESGRYLVVDPSACRTTYVAGFRRAFVPRPVAASVDDAITSRQSCRRFLDRPVSKQQLNHLLEVARFAPSGSNVQPWKVYAVGGEKKEALCTEILEDYRANGERQEREYEYYPTDWFEPYLARRRASGWGLYVSLEITR